MQKINVRGSSNRAALVVPFSSKLGLVFDTRATLISKMSGYPTALHAIGRLQRYIKLDSPASLLESLTRLGNLAYTTAEVMESLDATRVDRYQVNRQEIVTYVDNVTATLKNFTPTDDEKDLIAHLITASEASPTAWALSGGEGESNLHRQFYNLYRQVLLDGDVITIPIYSSATDSVSTFDKLFPVVRNKKESEDAFNKRVQHRDNELVIYRLALTRLIDHVYQLMTDRETWYQFVAPRVKAEVATNLERARTLKVLALYTQSLLTYHQYFSLEVFLKGYELVQEWIAHFPSLETETMKRLETTIRSHDFLGAREDVRALFASFSKDADQEHKAMMFPEELLAPFGIKDRIMAIDAAVRKYDLPKSLSELSSLSDPKFLPLTSGVAASTFDVVHDLASVLLKNKEVSHVIDTALWGIVPSITRGSAKAAISGLTDLGIKCNIPFAVPHATSFQIMAGAEKGVRNGVLRLDSASPNYSLAYHEFLRNTKKLSLFVDSTIPPEYPEFNMGFFVDYDKAADLRNILEQNSWSTFQPDWLASADRAYDYDHFSRSKENTRQFIEMLSGRNYEIVIREMTLEHVRKMWATFMSGCGLLYYVEGDVRSLDTIMQDKEWTLEMVARMKLVEGYGRPFGTTYANLEQLQGVLSTDSKVLALGFGLYFRFLSEFPVPIDDLRVDEDIFYNQHPVTYFSANSTVVKVKRWVIGEGLWNFGLIPTRTQYLVPSVKFTQKLAFLTANMYINTNFYYKPGASDATRENIDLPVVVSEWPYERHQYYLKYTHFGNYSQKASSEAPKEDEQLLADSIKKIEAQMDKEVKEVAEQTPKAGTGTQAFLKQIGESVKEGSEEIQGKNIDKDTDRVTI